jgi:hypothetical protein
MSEWRIFFWAMLHSPEFRYCYIRNPIAFGFRVGRTADSRIFWLSLTFQALGPYMPWSVRDAFYFAHKDEPAVETMFDDIPF